MMLMYALERRHRFFAPGAHAFAAGCALSASYGFLERNLALLEAIWCAIAVHRFFRTIPTRTAGP